MSFLDTLFNQSPVAQTPTAGGTLPDSIYHQMLAAAPDSAVPAASKGGGGIGSILAHLAGNIGDSFLQMKWPEVYKAQQEDANNKQIGEILQGYNTDPLGTINKIAAVDPTLAQRYYDHYQTSLYHQNMIGVDNQRLAASTAKVDDAKTNFVMQRVANMIGAKGVNADNYQKVRDVARAYASGKGVTNLPFDIPDTYDPDEIAAISNYGMNLKDQSNAAYHDTRATQMQQALGIQQQRANDYGRSVDTGQDRAKTAARAQAATAEHYINTEGTAQENADTNKARQAEQVRVDTVGRHKPVSGLGTGTPSGGPSVAQLPDAGKLGDGKTANFQGRPMYITKGGAWYDVHTGQKVK